MSDEPLLKVDGLSKFYGQRIGCVDVSFELWPGEVLAVVGLVFDVLLAIYTRDRRRRHLDDTTMREQDFYGLAVLVVATIAVAYPDIIVTRPRVLDALLPPGLLLAVLAADKLAICY